VVDIDEVRRLALSLPRTTEGIVRDRVKFRVGRIVYLAFSRDESLMGFGYPKEERDALVASDPSKFLMPGQSDMRYNWAVVRLGAIDEREMRELVIDAWRMVVPKRVAAEHLGGEVLAGGMANPGAVVRIGDEVRRPSSPHTESIFALVGHARARGFTGAPEPLGIDEFGRERWEFVPGDVPLPPFPGWSQSDELLASTAELLRRFHDAVADFVAPSDATWNNELAFVHAAAGRAPAPSALVYGHNDVCPENVICRDGAAVAIIDFDFAAPTDPLHDVGQLAKMWVPLEPDEDARRTGRAGLDRFERLRIIADSYGVDGDDDRERLLDIIVTTIHRGSLFARTRVDRGEQPFVEMWNASGGQARYDRRSAWIDANRDRLLGALTR
jgi:hypothetical protein